MSNQAPSFQEAQSHVLASYWAGERQGYDEVLDSGGNVRPHWSGIISGLAALSPEEVASRAGRLSRRVLETGIAYDIFADPLHQTQRWQLDLAPLVFSSAEWQWLQKALTQRARLFDSLLRDLYGDASLMRRGLIPPELVYSDHAYLRPCQGILPNAGPLRFFAADLARGKDGQWRVIDNHAETLAGIGFAVANRVVHTQIVGDIFKRCNAIRLAPFFNNLQNALAAHTGRENARIALLTPGPHHEDYFAHAYLARYLGLLLVEGSDLRTKGTQVYLKTLEGLKEIDLIVRCVEGRLIDALELDSAGMAGPAGLIRVNRANTRLVTNAIGTAVVQNRGFGPYLPALAKDLLGEDLLLRDAPRYWLGDPSAREHVLANLKSFIIHAAQEGTGRPGAAALGKDAQTLSEADIHLLKSEIALHGRSLVAEEKVGFSEAPAFKGDGLVPRPFAVRLYVAHTGSGYEVMPGGLAMSVDPRVAVALSASEAHTRDVWVLSESEQRPHVSLWRPTLESARVQRSQRVIQSRVADNLFWLGRYNERADWIMRVLRGTFRRMDEDSSSGSELAAAQLCMSALTTEYPQGLPNWGPASDWQVQQLSTTLINSQSVPRSLVSTFENLYRCASLVRDRLSHEAWQTLSKFHPDDSLIAGLCSADPGAVADGLEEGIAGIAAFNGLMHENMTRNYGWAFLDMGRRLERAYNLCEAMLALFIPAPDPEEEVVGLKFVLEVADSFITYRSRYRLDPSLPLVLDLLLLDETNPRSLAYQLSAIADHLERLPASKRGISLGEDRKINLSLLTRARLTDIEGLAEEKQRLTLEQLIRTQLEQLPELSDAIGRVYFNLTDEAQQRAHIHVEPQA